MRRKIQVIFQDPYSSLNPRMTVGQIIGEPLQRLRARRRPQGRRERASPSCSSRSGCFPYMAERYPHELSGGQRQRVGIARALAMEPSLHRLRRAGLGARRLDPGRRSSTCSRTCSARLGLTYLFIAHDLAVVRHISDRVVGDVSRPRRWRSPTATTLYARPAASLHQGAARRRARSPTRRSRSARAPRADQGRIAVPLTPPSGLRLPYPLPDGERGMPARSSRRCDEIAAGTFCGLHQSLSIADAIKRDGNGTGRDAMTNETNDAEDMVGSARARRAALALATRPRPTPRQPKRGGTLQLRDQRRDRRTTICHGSDTYATLHFAAPFYSTLLRFNLAEIPARSKATSRSPGRSRPT